MARALPLSRFLAHDEPHGPVAQFLTIGEPTEQVGVYQLRTLGLAAIFEVQPLVASGIGPSELEQKALTIGQTIAAAMDIPDAKIRVSFSLTTYKSKDISNELAIYPPARADIHPVLGLLRDKHRESLRRGLDHPVLGDPENGLFIGTYRTIASITVHPETMPGGGAFQAMRDAGKDFIQSIAAYAGLRSGSDDNLTPIQQPFVALKKQLTDYMNRILAGVIDALSTEGMACRPVPPDGYLQVMHALMHPHMSRLTVPAYDPTRTLAEQVGLNDLVLDTRANRWQVDTGDAVFAVTTLQASPRESWPGILSRPNGNIGGRSIIHGLQHGFITVSGFAERQAEVDNFLEKRLDKVNSPMCPPALRSVMQPDLHEAQRYRAQGGRIISMQVIACCHGRTYEQARNRAEAAQRMFNRTKAESRVERSAAAQFFFQALPANAILPVTGMASGGHHRNRLVYDANFIEFSPIWHNSRGLNDGRQALTLLPNRHGEIGVIALNGSNVQHGIILGQTGSGKSFWAHKIKNEVLTDFEQIVIFDYQNSYGFSIGGFGDQGAVYNLGGQNRATLNIFEGTLDDVRDIAPTIINRLAAGEHDKLSQASVGLIEEILNKAFANNQDNCPFARYEDLIPEGHNSVFVHYARKRLLAQFVTAETNTNLEALRRRGEGRSPLFEVQYIYVLRSFTNTDTGATIQATDASKVPNHFRDLFAAKNCVLTDSPDGRVELLGGTADLERVLAARGVDLELDRTHCYVDVEQRIDAEDLARYGIVFVPSADLVETYTAELMADLTADPAYAGADAEKVRDIAVARARDLPPTRYYDALEGSAVLQNLVTFNDFGRILDDMAEAGTDGALDLQRRLSAYYGRGTRSSYFDGPTGFDLNKRAISFELDGLDGDPHLKSVTLAALLHVTGQYFKAPANRGKPRLLLVEEIHRHWGDVNVARALQIAWRENRKVGVFCWGVTQTVTEFETNPIAKSLLSQSPNRFIFFQTDSAETRNVLGTVFGMTEAEIELCLSVRSRAGAYSEFFWQHVERELRIQDVYVFLPDPYHYWDSTTHPEDTRLRTRLYIEASGRNGADGSERKPDAVIRREVIEELVRRSQAKQRQAAGAVEAPTTAVGA